MKFMNDEEAVSPVIGVILMVAITVILAAVIAVFVFGMAGDVQTTKVVTVTAKQVGNNLTTTYQGGSDSGNLQYLAITVINADGDTPVTTYWWFEDDGVHTEDAGVGVPAATVFETFDVGSTLSIDTPSMTTGQDQVIIVAHFDDSSEQVIVDKMI